MRPPSLLRFGLVAAVAASLTMTGLAAADAKAARPGRYIVVLKDSAEDPGRVANQHSRSANARVSHVYRSALKGYAAVIPNDRVAALRADSRVAFISEDRPVQIAAQILPTGVNRIEGDQSSQESGNGSNPATGGVRIRVAVIDTGSGPHKDINVVGGKNCSSGSSYNDANGHGTHVAGIIGAKDSPGGVVGVAPGASMYSVRVLNSSGAGSWSSVICGIDWVTNTNAHPPIPVANLSLGGAGTDDGNCGNTNGDALHRAICRSVAKGTTYVVAAGNKTSDFGRFSPATYSEVLTVTALADYNGQPGGGPVPSGACRPDVDDTAADFSNFTTPGSDDENHTIAAPGVCIRSTWTSGGYKLLSGTSMASPHAAGALALCLQSGACATDSTPSELISKLRADAMANSDTSQVLSTADPNTPYYGFQGDPNTATAGSDGITRYYGDLLYVGGY